MSGYIELDEIFRRYAYKILRERVGWFKRWLMNEEDYFCEVDWSHLTLDHKVIKFAPSSEDGVVMETNWGNVMSGKDIMQNRNTEKQVIVKEHNTGPKTAVWCATSPHNFVGPYYMCGKSGQAVSVSGSRWVSLWSCDFDNKADGKQSHTFRGSRDTTTWVDVELKQYYTVDKEPNININLPPSFTKVRAGRDNTLHVNKVKGQIYKELLTWEVNSQVEVVPGWKAHAELLAKEESYNIEFEIRTTIYNPKGVVPVYFKRKNDGKIVYKVNLFDYQCAFKSEEDGGVVTAEEKPFIEFLTEVTDKDGEETEQKCYPQLVSNGAIDCLCWSDQKVDIKTSPLSGDHHQDGDRNSVSSSSDRGSVISNRDSTGLNYTSSYTERKVMKRTVVG